MKQMKKNYDLAEIEIIRFEAHDVITVRIPTHRFKTLEATLIMNGNTAQTLHSFEIETR